MINKMDKQKELNELLTGIKEEIESLKKDKEKFPDYENRIEELEKEANQIQEELKTN